MHQLTAPGCAVVRTSDRQNAVMTGWHHQPWASRGGADMAGWDGNAGARDCAGLNCEGERRVLRVLRWRDGNGRLR
jgi:hypothetical protein